MTLLTLIGLWTWTFLLTRPSRDVTTTVDTSAEAMLISTHTSLAGRDIYGWRHRDTGRISTHTSLAGRDWAMNSKTYAQIISTHTSLAGRDSACLPEVLVFDISTHTSLAGRDVIGDETLVDVVISTHTSLAGRDAASNLMVCCPSSFLLTRPSRDVTDNQHQPFPSNRKFLLTRPSRDVTMHGTSWKPA